MKNVDAFISRDIAHIKKLYEVTLSKNEKKYEKVLHSLPIPVDERFRREHEAEEQRRFRDMPGTYKITRNASGYIIEIRKQVEDVVLEYTYTRDANNYVTAIESRLKKETKA